GVQADVFQRVHGRRLARTAEAGEHHQRHAHRAASQEPGASNRHATMASCLSTPATSATVASSVPAHTSTGPGSESRAANPAPPTWRWTILASEARSAPTACAAPSPCKALQRRPSCTSLATMPDSTTRKLGTELGWLINSQSYELRNPTSSSTQPLTGARGLSSTASASAVMRPRMTAASASAPSRLVKHAALTRTYCWPSDMANSE